jgi:hypothetical protein
MKTASMDKGCIHRCICSTLWAASLPGSKSMKVSYNE